MSLFGGRGCLPPIDKINGYLSLCVKAEHTLSVWQWDVLLGSVICRDVSACVCQIYSPLSVYLTQVPFIKKCILFIVWPQSKVFFRQAAGWPQNQGLIYGARHGGDVISCHILHNKKLTCELFVAVKVWDSNQHPIAATLLHLWSFCSGGKLDYYVR